MVVNAAQLASYSQAKQLLVGTGRKEGNVLFNGALIAFLFYGYMASDIW